MSAKFQITLVLAHLCVLSMGQNDYEFAEQTGHWYSFHTEGASWADARATCTQEGGGLAIINSVSERDVLKLLYDKHYADIRDAAWINRVAIGVYKDGANWKTTDGQSLAAAGFAQWDKRHPLNDDRNVYGFMGHRGVLLSRKGSDRTAFICEKTSHS